MILCHMTKIKIKDPTNGFRMFSRKLLNSVSIKSKEGFSYSIELLIKAKKQPYAFDVHNWHYVTIKNVNIIPSSCNIPEAKPSK